MRADKLGLAIQRMEAARVFMWEHVPAGTPGKVQIDLDLFNTTNALNAELSQLDISIQSLEPQRARSTS